MQFALASVIDLTRNFRNADIEMMKRIGFGKHNIVRASPITYVTPDDLPFLLSMAIKMSSSHPSNRS